MTKLAENPRFVCAREGHEPVKFKATGMVVESFICPCPRCGRLATYDGDGKPVEK